MKVKDLLDQHGITSIYHFTDHANLESIKKFGIQSLRSIDVKNIPVVCYGAESLSHYLDRKYGLDKFVHLAFIKDHPMYHVAKQRGTTINPVWIEVDISVLFKSETLFCNQIANQNNAYLFSLPNIVDCIDFPTMLYSNDFYSRKEARKAEILVLESIEPNLIKGISYGK